jgi:putative transposase
VGRAILPAAAFQAARHFTQIPRIPPFPLHHITMKHHERRLPHWDVVEHPLFVTFHLHGSLPAARVFPPDQLTSGKAFVAMDHILDRAVNGPSFLRRPDIAGLVAAALRDGEARFRRYQLHAFVIMPNHVHALATPHVPATRWLGPLKGFTAHLANQILGHVGQPFWQDESYDHLVRSDAEFGRIQAYIEQNPVSAGLVGTAEEFRWSSVHARGAA